MEQRVVKGMTDQLDVIEWSIAWHGILENSLPMSWNLFLALLPLALSCELFHRPRSPIVYWGIWFLVVITLSPFVTPLMTASIEQFGGTPVIGVSTALLVFGIGRQFQFPGIKHIYRLLWWIGCVIFILFLPNAAYVLTDVIHFVHDARKDYTMGTLVLILLPQYLLFLITGFQAYVAALMNVGYFLKSKDRESLIPFIEVGTHALVAIAIYLGRFARLNSWDVFTVPVSLARTMTHVFLSTHSMLTISIFFIFLMVLYWLCKRINIGLLAQKEAFRAMT